jgi:hypothetical protein
MESANSRREEIQRASRRANRRLRDIAQRRLPDAASVPFLCECAAEFCRGTVDVTVAEWDAVAAKANHFVMEAGHPLSEGENVVGSVRAFDVAEKAA